MRNTNWMAAMVMALGVTFAGGAASTAAQQAPAQNPPSTSTQKPAAKSQSSSSTAAKKPAAPAPPSLATDKDKRSYAIGMSIGKGIQKQGIDVDPDLIARGIHDELTNAKPLLTDEEAQATLTALQSELRQKAQQEYEAASVANQKQSEDFLAANKAKDGVVTLPSGLQYKVITEGTGPKPAATDTVTCNYRGTLVDGTEFDSSEKRGQPLTIGVGNVIPGWSQALQLMPVGSKWELYIPPDLAYGPRGKGPIGPNQALIFQVELLSIQQKPPVEPVPGMQPQTQPGEPAQPGGAEAPKPESVPPAPKH